MRILPFQEKSLLLICALAASLGWRGQTLAARPAPPQQPGPSANAQVEDAEQRAGPFAIAGQAYTLVLHEKRIARAEDPALAQTLVSEEILDAAGNVSYRKAFTYTIEQGRFQRSLSASAQLVSGKTGAGLVIHYREESAATPTSAARTSESWQLFGLVNSKLAPLGKPLPI